MILSQYIGEAASSQVTKMIGTSGGASKGFTDTSATSNFTITDYTPGNAVLLVGTYGEGLPTNLTWDGIGGFTLVDFITQGSRVAAVHKLDNPFAGTFNLTMTADSFDDLHFGHIVFEGTGNPTMGISTTDSGSGTSSSISLIAGLNDIMFAAFSGSGSGTFTPTSGNLIYNNTIGSVSGCVSWDIGTGGLTTLANSHPNMSHREAALTIEP